MAILFSMICHDVHESGSQHTVTTYYTCRYKPQIWLSGQCC